MEVVASYFEANQEWLAERAILAGHLLVGFVLSGLTLGCFYFIYFISGVLRLEKGSREYYQLREHIMPESLLRYGITVACIFTIDGLILIFFEWGTKAMAVGIALCLLFLASKEAVRMMGTRKAKQI